MSNCDGAIDRAQAYINNTLPGALAHALRLDPRQGAERQGRRRRLPADLQRRGLQRRHLVLPGRGDPAQRDGRPAQRQDWRAAASARGFSFANPTSRVRRARGVRRRRVAQRALQPDHRELPPEPAGHASGYTPTVSPLLTGAAVTVTAATLRQARGRVRPALAAQQRSTPRLDAAHRARDRSGARPDQRPRPAPRRAGPASTWTAGWPGTDQRHRAAAPGAGPGVSVAAGRSVRMPARRLLALAAALVLGRAALVACDREAGGTDPRRRGRRHLAGPRTGRGRPRRRAVRRTTPAAARTAYDGIVAGMGGVEPRGRGRRGRASRATPRATLAWTWPLGADELDLRRHGRADPRRRHWQVRLGAVRRRARAGRRRACSTPRRIAPDPRRRPRRRRRRAGHRPAGRPGRHRPGAVSGRGAAAVRAPAGRGLVGIDPGGTSAGSGPPARRPSSRRSSTAAATCRRPWRGYDRIPGAAALRDELPLAPTEGVRRADPRHASARSPPRWSRSDPEKYHAGDVAGLSGLQARYDDQLRGHARVQSSTAVDPDGKDARAVPGRARAPGEPLRTTLDPGLQREAERLLAGVGPASALVAIRPSHRRRSWPPPTAPGNDGYNMATFGQFAPGSTFKSVSSLALLRAGLTPDVRRAVHADDHGRRQGRSRTTPTTRPARSGGSRCGRRWPTPATPPSSPRPPAGRGAPGRRGRLAGLGRRPRPRLPGVLRQRPGRRLDTEAAADMIGQGKVLASPMAMAAVIASVQQGGLVVPRLLDVGRRQAPSGAAPLTAAEAAALRAMLRGVVTDGQRPRAARRARAAGDREDRHRRVRGDGDGAHARLDDRRPGRPGGRGVRRHRRVRLAAPPGRSSRRSCARPAR